ncbi:hypothetical protein IT575_00160 [bacterium]|nr:hypothetical protein [bacterium]
MRGLRWPGSAVLLPLFQLIALCSLCLLLLPLQGQAKIERTLCDVCGRVWDDSPARMRARVDLGHNHSRTLYACCPFCMLERMEDYKDRNIGTLQIVLHKEHKENAASMLVAERSWFLIGIEGDEEKNAEPYVAAFRNKKAAEEGQKKLGGEAIDWETLLGRVRKLTDDFEPRAPKDYPPLRPGRSAD